MREGDPSAWWWFVALEGRRAPARSVNEALRRTDGPEGPLPGLGNSGAAPFYRVVGAETQGP